jgi:hypothetical protein
MSLPKNLIPNNSESDDSRAWIHKARREAASSNGITDAPVVALAQDFALTTDAANLVIAYLDNRPQMRAFVDAVIGATGGEPYFVEITDEELAKRLGRTTKTVQNYRNEFREISEHGLLIEIKDNWRDPQTHESHPHAYKCKITALAVEATQNARQSSQWTHDRKKRLKVLEDASAKVSAGATLGALRKAKRQKKPTDAEVVTRKLRMATNAMKDAAKRRDMVKNPDFEMLWELRQEHLAALSEFDEAYGFTSMQDRIDQVETEQLENTQVENFSTQIDLTESTTYENREAQPAGGSVEMAVEAARAFDVAEFQVTMLDDEKPKGLEPELYEPLSKDDFEKWLPNLLRRNAGKSESLIVRPVASNLIQIDDCDRAMLERLQPFSLLTFETSAGSYQAILALPADTEKPERNAVRRRLLAQFQEADWSASGAMRWPGSFNHKRGRNKFMVRLCAAHPGRLVTVAELEAANMLAPVPPPSQPTQPERPRAARAPVSWPNYERCVREAPKKQSGEADLSIADKNWSILALDRGWPDAEVEAKLCELRDKAKRRPEYARKTVAYAARVVNSRA